jgi:MerR family transcriptional regulator/heat shock protein HspR
MEAVTMTARYVRLQEVCVKFAIDDTLLHDVCAEGLVEVKQTTGEEPVVSAEDAERLRLITVLMREMDVNLAGAEVILHMREDAVAMQRQFDEIVRTLVEELRQRLAR